jgi:Ca2+-binding RTX toxin-like protein
MRSPRIVLVTSAAAVISLAVATDSPQAAPSCFGKQATIVRGGGNDHVQGTPGRDVIFTGMGNDTVASGDGVDYVCGGDGDDTIDTGIKNDFLDGGDGNDELHGYDGGDKIVGGAGKDFLDGRRGDDNVLLGGAGNDRLLGDSVLKGGGGDDKINGAGYVSSDPVPDRSSGGGGDDRITGDDNSDRLKGGRGNDKINGRGREPMSRPVGTLIACGQRHRARRLSRALRKSPARGRRCR